MVVLLQKSFLSFHLVRILNSVATDQLINLIWRKTNFNFAEDNFKAHGHFLFQR